MVSLLQFISGSKKSLATNDPVDVVWMHALHLFHSHSLTYPVTATLIRYSLPACSMMSSAQCVGKSNHGSPSIRAVFQSGT